MPKLWDNGVMKNEIVIQELLDLKKRISFNSLLIICVLCACLLYIFLTSGHFSNNKFARYIENEIESTDSIEYLSASVSDVKNNSDADGIYEITPSTRPIPDEAYDSRQYRRVYGNCLDGEKFTFSTSTCHNIPYWKDRARTFCDDHNNGIIDRSPVKKYIYWDRCR